MLDVKIPLENNSEHPLAESIVEKTKSKNINLMSVSDFEAIEGKGVKGKIIINGLLAFAVQVVYASTPGDNEKPNATTNL